MENLIAILHTYKYVIMIPLSIFEGPIVIIVGGFLTTVHFMDPFIVYGIGVFGDLVGDGLFYGMGRLGSTKIFKYGHYIGVTHERLSYAKHMFANHQRKALIVSKLVHGIGVVGLIVAGAIHMPFKKYFKITAAIAFLQSALLLTVGIFAGSAYTLIDKYLSRYAAFASAGVIVVAGIVLLTRAKNSLGKSYGK